MQHLQRIIAGEISELLWQSAGNISNYIHLLGEARRSPPDMNILDLASILQISHHGIEIFFDRTDVFLMVIAKLANPFF